MTSPNDRNETRGGGEEPVIISDKRKIDPETGELRQGGGFFSSPFGRKSDPGDPNEASQPIAVTTEADLALEAAQLEAAERTADLQRVTAEYANYRKRVDRDRDAAAKAATTKVLTDLLTVLDDIDRADRHGDLTGAFKAVAERLTGILTKSGLSQFGVVGDEFDPAKHEAVQFATGSEVTVQTVTTVMRHGYTLGDRLVRPAVVGVTGPGADGGADTASDAVSDDVPAAPGAADEVIDAEVIDAEVVDAEIVDGE